MLIGTILIYLTGSNILDLDLDIYSAALSLEYYAEAWEVSKKGCYKDRN